MLIDCMVGVRLNLYLMMKLTIMSVKLEDKVNTPNDSDARCFIAVDSKSPDEIKEKTKYFHFALRLKLVLKNKLVIILLRSNQLHTHKIGS